MAIEPKRRCLEWPRRQAVRNDTPLFGARHDARCRKQLQMFHHRWKRDPKRPRERAHREVTIQLQPRDQRASGWVRQRSERAAEPFLLKVNHLVK